MQISDIPAAAHNIVFCICGSLDFEEELEVQFWL